MHRETAKLLGVSRQTLKNSVYYVRLIKKAIKTVAQTGSGARSELPGLWQSAILLVRRRLKRLISLKL